MQREMTDFAPAKRLKKDSAQMKQYWQAAQAAHISQQAETLLKSERFGQENKFMEYSHLRLFIERHMKYVVDLCEDSPSLVAAFDENCLLIDLRGSAASVKRAKQLGVRLGGDWSLAHIGPNAVSVGAAEERRTISVGEENYTFALQKYAIYFAPILLCEVNPPFEAKFRGGIAVLVPKELQNPDYQMVASSAAMNIIKGTHHYMRHYRRYRMTQRGLLTVDALNRTTPVISSMDQPLFDILGIPEADYRQKPVRELVDGYPQNPRFWSIIQRLEEVNDLELSLSIRGRKVACIITTDAYYQPALQVEGVHFFITTPQWIARDVSEKIGNSAVRTFDAIVGRSSAIKSAVNRARLMANTESNVIIVGESGVGKDVFAQAIHNNGRRRDKPFIAVNCGALSRDLIASELFGYECQRRYEIVRKRRRNFVIFRRRGEVTKIRCCLAQKECLRCAVSGA